MMKVAVKVFAFPILALVLSSTLVNAGGKKKGRKLAATIWWVAFNEPGKCINAPEAEVKCGPRDVFGDKFLASLSSDEKHDPTLLHPNPDAEIGLIYATGGLSDRDGTFHAIASLWRTDDPLHSDANVDPFGLNRGWTNPDAEIHAVIRTHGKAIFKHDRYVQQTTNVFDDFCSDPAFLYKGSKFNGNLCADIQDVLSPPGVGGELPLGVMRSDPPRHVKGGRAIFYRRGDHVQASIETNIKYY